MRMGTYSRETFRRASRRIRKSHSTSSTSSNDEELQEGGYTLMVPVEHNEKGTKIKLKPKRLRKVPGMIRKSFRRAAKSPNVDVVNETDEMDLTEIKTSDNELLPPKIPPRASETKRRKSPALSAGSAPIPGSKSTTPSVISSHSFQPVIIDFGDDSKPDLYAVKQDSDHSESPPSPNITFPPPPLIPPPPQEEGVMVSSPPTPENIRSLHPILTVDLRADLTESPDKDLVALTPPPPAAPDLQTSQQGSTPPKDPSPPKLRRSTESTPTPKNSNSDIFEKQSSV